MKLNKPDMTKVEEAFTEVLKAMNLDLNDSNLKETPKRLAKMYVTELFAGMYEDVPDIKSFESDKSGLLYTKVPFRSTCAHHFQPINGDVHIFVDYRNSEYVLGLSKFNRIVEHQANRPTLQEDLTKGVLNVLVEKLGTDNVMVIIEATHHCVTDRGVCADYSNTLTQHTKSKCKDFIKTCNTYFKRG